MSAVIVPVSTGRASIMFVDSRARLVYGQVYVDDYSRNDRVQEFVGEVMGAIRAAYDEEAAAALARGGGLPPAAATLRRLKAVIASKVQGEVQRAS